MTNWKTKLTSRKFWAAVAEFVAMLLVFFNYPQDKTTQITALIMAGAAVIAYIVGEGLIDAASMTSPPKHAAGQNDVTEIAPINIDTKGTVTVNPVNKKPEGGKSEHDYTYEGDDDDEQ